MTGHLLSRCLADLAEHPDSTAREIARRIGERNDRNVWRVLNEAAYDGLCQRWRPGNPRSAWRWEIPGPPQVKEEKL